MRKEKIMKECLCLKCGEKFLSERPYNRICGNCSLINERIAFRTHSVSSKLLDEEYSISRYFSAWQEGTSADS